MSFLTQWNESFSSKHYLLPAHWNKHMLSSKCMWMSRLLPYSYCLLAEGELNFAISTGSYATTIRGPVGTKTTWTMANLSNYHCSTAFKDLNTWLWSSTKSKMNQPFLLHLCCCSELCLPSSLWLYWLRLFVSSELLIQESETQILVRTKEGKKTQINNSLCGMSGLDSVWYHYLVLR